MNYIYNVLPKKLYETEYNINEFEYFMAQIRIDKTPISKNLKSLALSVNKFLINQGRYGYDYIDYIKNEDEEEISFSWQGNNSLLTLYVTPNSYVVAYSSPAKCGVKTLKTLSITDSLADVRRCIA
jgi:hypothetical protein